MKKRKLIVTGSLAATLLLTGSKATLADTTVVSKTSVSRSTAQKSLQLEYLPGSGPTLNTVAEELGINADDFREELRQGNTPKQVLEDQGFSSSQIQKIFRSSSSKSLSKNFESEE